MRRVQPSEADLRRLAEEAPVLLWTSDEHDRATFMNAEYVRFLGRPLEALIGGGWRESVHPEDADGYVARFVEAAARRERFEAEVRFRRADGEYRWMRTIGVPCFERGVYRGYAGTMVDIHERKLAEEALHASEARYRAIVEGQAEMVCRFRMDGTMLFANGAYARARGTTPEALVGSSFWQFIPEADHAAVRAMLERLTPASPEIRIENRFASAEGERWTLWTNRAIAFDGAGRLLEAQSTGIDITARKHAEEALRESEGRFRTMADTAPAMLWVSVPGQGVTFLSRGWYEFTGQTEADALGNGWMNALHPDDRAPVRRVLSDAGRRREPYAVHYRLRRADGEYRWVIDSGRPRLEPAGGFLGYIGSVIDVHELKQAEEARRQSDERFRAIFGQAAAGVAQTDLTGRFTLVNPAYCTMVGRPAEELYGMRMQDITHPDDVAPNVAFLERLAAHGEPYALEKRYVRPDGSLVWVSNYVSALKDTEGRPFASLASVQEITARKLAEEALREADRRKDEFIAMLSHELRNPLAPLRNGLHLLRLGRNRAPDASLLEMMERQVGHLVRMVDDLLEMSRVSRGELELRKERLALAEIVAAAVETSEPLIRAASHHLSVSLPEAALYVDGDAVRLAQILANLLNNAARHTEPGRRIEVAARAEDAMAAISVRDDGPGIAPDVMPKLFQMFSRSEQSARRGHAGLGIGLALARRLAEMHGGTVEAASEGPGKGAVFTVRLPLAQAAASRASPAPAGSVHVPPRRVLVVDDNRDAAESLGMLLEALGAEVRVAFAGPDALEAFRDYEPAMVLLDIGMPGMDGYEVARRMREHPAGRRVPIVALTGWGQAADRRRTREAGFDDHLVKPADLNALQSLLASVRPS